MTVPSPEFSVIIRCFNRRDRVTAAIESVLAQTDPDFEIIVVDDASTDGSYEQVQDLFGADERLLVVRHEENKGAAAAANTGVSHAQGNLIAFLDSDDAYLPACLEAHRRALQDKPDAVMSYGDYVQVWDAQGFERPLACGTDDQDQRLGTLKGGFIHSQSLIALRREVLAHVGPFDESLQISHDFDLWMRLALSYEQPFVHVPRPLVRYALSTDGVTKRYERWWQEAKHVIAMGKAHAAARPYLHQLEDVDRRVGGNILARQGVEHWVSKGKPQPVSVVIPLVGRIDVLDDAIRSVQEQSTSVSEVVFVVDRTQPPAYQKHADVLIEAGVGVVTLVGDFSERQAIMRGMRVAQGPLVAFLRPCDKWRPAYLDEQMRANSFPSEMPVFTYSDLQVQSDEGGKQTLPHKHDWQSSDLVSEHQRAPYPHSLSCMMVRSDVVPFLQIPDGQDRFSGADLAAACLATLSETPDRKKLGGPPLHIVKPLVEVTA